MGDLSKHFSRSEFACKCGKCEPIAVDYKLVQILEMVRTHFDAAVIITSGYRCPKHNKKVKGARASKHMLGIAADIKVSGVEPIDVYSAIDAAYPNDLGLKVYSSWVHVDSRQDKWRSM
jgi:uncharacterized protein YcbK (DUF882 family)